MESLKEVKYFDNLIKKINFLYPKIEENILTYQMLRISISDMINDIINFSSKTIETNNIKNLNDIKNFNKFLISMSVEMQKYCSEISSFLHNNVYNHSKLLKKRSNSELIIYKLFEYYIKNFDKLPKDWLSKTKSEEKQRIICDYISGMTDRYASKLYESIYE